MNNKPRIAFCFSGQARTLDQTYLFFQKNLFDAAKEQGFDYDVFCAVEDDVDVDKVKLLNPTKIEKIKSSDVEKIIEERYGDFIKTAFKTKYKWASITQSTFEGLVRYLQQVYKVSSSITLCNNYDNYDIIIRLRFDTIYINKFNFVKIRSKLLNGNNIICNDQPKSDGVWYRYCYSTWEIQDLIFIGNGVSMKFLGGMFEDFEQCFLGHEVKLIFKPIYFVSNWLAQFVLYVNNNTKLHIPSLPKEFGAYMIFIPEKSYYEFLLYHKVNIIKTDISLILVRKDIKKSYVKLDDKTEYEL